MARRGYPPEFRRRVLDSAGGRLGQGGVLGFAYEFTLVRWLSLRALAAPVGRGLAGGLFMEAVFDVFIAFDLLRMPYFANFVMWGVLFTNLQVARTVPRRPSSTRSTPTPLPERSHPFMKIAIERGDGRANYRPW